MKVSKLLNTVLLILLLSHIANAQQNQSKKDLNGVAILSGNVFDSLGSLLIGAKVTAINNNGKKFEAVTNDKGGYSLELPFAKSKRGIPLTKYEIVVELMGFRKFVIKEFNFVPAKSGKMNLDIALEVGQIE